MTDHASSAGAPAPGIVTRLSAMMFLQYAIWGAWLPLFFSFLTKHRGFSGEQAGNLFAVAAIGALVAPFLAGQIADRWLASQKFLGVSHLAGAVLVWQLAVVEEYSSLVVYGLLYSLVYAPTISLTNSIAFHHLPDRDRDFGKVRVWGTVGWIVVGIGMGQWLFRSYGVDALDPEFADAERAAGMADAFRVSAVLGVILGIFSFTLPATPPQAGRKKFALAEVFSEMRQGPLVPLFLIAFPISCVHQFYFVRTEGFLAGLDVATPAIDAIFGVGGGPMTLGQIAEIVVLAAMPFLARRFSRKTLLSVGLLAYIARFGVFAYLPHPWAVYPALLLHGLCFGCFFFICFMIVDEETTPDVRASAQSLFNLVAIGFGVIAGNFAAGQVDKVAAREDGTTSFTTLFAIPMGVTVVCLLALWAFYPGWPKEEGATRE